MICIKVNQYHKSIAYDKMINPIILTLTRGGWIDFFIRLIHKIIMKRKVLLSTDYKSALASLLIMVRLSPSCQVGSTVDNLAKSNGINDPNRIKAGQTLTVM